MSSCSNPTPPPSSSSSSNAEDEEETLTLFPTLPNDLSSLILAMVPYSHHSRLKPICKSWKSFFSSSNKTLLSLRTQTHQTSHLLCIFPQDPSVSPPYLFDPRNLAWRPLPPMPCNPHTYALSNFVSISLNTHLYILGGSLFDARSFPIDRPCPSSSTFRFDFETFTWDRLSPMISPRGSFACAAIAADTGRIVVAGGGSRHAMFGAAGSRMNSAEMYDVEKDEWVALDGLPRFRAGCVGFLVGEGEGAEFWVMGGYGESRTVSGVFPVDKYYRDGVVLELRNGGGKWREIGDMWEEGDRRRLGSVVVVDDGDCGEAPGVFMLDGGDVFRYNMSCNRWSLESSVPRKPQLDSFGFVALDGELHVLSPLNTAGSMDIRKPRQHKRGLPLLIQIYDPKRRKWRSSTTRAPFQDPLDFKTAVMCTLRL